MSRAVDETGFLFPRRAILMTFSTLASAPTLLGASPCRGGFSSLLPDVTSMVGVCLSRTFIIRFYYTLINIISYFHTLTNINSFLKCDRLKIKALYIGLSRPDVRHTVNDDLVYFGYDDLIIQSRTQKGRKILIYIN